MFSDLFTWILIHAVIVLLGPVAIAQIKKKGTLLEFGLSVVIVLNAFMMLLWIIRLAACPGR